MRSQLVVLGHVEREIYVRLSQDLLPPGTKPAEEISQRITGCAVSVAERLSRLSLSAAIITGIGTTDEDKQILGILRKRGIQTRGIRSGSTPTPTTIRIRTPRHEVRMTSSVSTNTPSKQAILRALPGSRHFHVCGAVLAEPASQAPIRTALARARALGATTSLDVAGLPPTSDRSALEHLLVHVDVVFADSGTLRAIVDRPRIGAAATTTLELGVDAVAVRLGSGGSRIYTRDNAVRIPRLGAEVEHAGSAFASGYLLGWLLGASSEISGVLGAAAALEKSKTKLPDRRDLASRLAEARRNPQFRKLVPALSDAQRVVDRARRLPRRNLASRPVSP